MIELVKRFNVSTIQRFSLIVLVIVFCTGCSFTDNATELAYQLESASTKLKSKKDGSEIIIHYEPKDSKAPFTILVLSDKGTTSDELYQKGLDSSIVEYLGDLKKGSALVVYQNGIMSSTTYHARFVDVAATQIIKSTGNTDIVMKKIGVGLGRFTKGLILIELRMQVK
jgi:hypothetical protein